MHNMSNNASELHIGTSSFEPDNRVLSSYLADGTLTKRYFSSMRTRTTVRVNSKGDTIVRTIREPVIDRTLYRGDWEISGSVWRLNTPEGIARVVKNASTSDAQGGASVGRTFTHLWYVRDRLGSVRTVLDDNGTIRQCTMFYPSGLPVQLFGTERVTDRAHIGNRWSGFAGLGWHDNTARWHDAILDRFTTPDPKSAESPSHSTYVFCSGNPINRIDFDGKKDWPVPRVYNGHTRRHSNNYGEYRGRRLPHQGLDINLGSGYDDYGCPVYATHDGKVVRVAYYYDDKNPGGTRIKIQSYDGSVSTFYMHLSDISDNLKVGDDVSEGQQIGKIGASSFGNENSKPGGKWASHLHYELELNGKKIDPANGPGQMVDAQKLILSPPDNSIYFMGTLETIEVKATGSATPMPILVSNKQLEIPALIDVKL